MSTQEPSSRTKMYAFAFTECLLVFPAAFVIAVAALRGVQPRQYEPARTSWVFEWITTRHSHLDAAIIFLLFPAVALALGVYAFFESWRQDERLRWDTVAFGSVLRRNMHFLVLAAGAVAGAAIFTAAVVHMITD